MEYETTMYETSTNLTAAEAAALSGVTAVVGLVTLFVIIMMIIGWWKLFTKAGEPGWKAIIPIYNGWTFLKLGGQSGWWSLAVFVPFIGWIATAVFLTIAAYNIGLKLGKEGWYVILFVLVSPIWALILGFDKSTWNAHAAGTIPSPVGSSATGQPVPPQPKDAPDDKPPTKG